MGQTDKQHEVNNFDTSLLRKAGPGVECTEGRGGGGGGWEGGEARVAACLSPLLILEIC